MEMKDNFTLPEDESDAAVKSFMEISLDWNRDGTVGGHRLGPLGHVDHQRAPLHVGQGLALTHVDSCIVR